MNPGLNKIFGALFAPTDLFAWQSCQLSLDNQNWFLSQTGRIGYQILRQLHRTLCLTPETAALGGQPRVNTWNSQSQIREYIYSNCMVKITKDVYHTPSINLENAHATHLGIVTVVNAKPSIMAEACK